MEKGVQKIGGWEEGGRGGVGGREGRKIRRRILSRRRVIGGEGGG